MAVGRYRRRVRWYQRCGLFLAGALGGAACDQIHVQSGVLTYAHPAFLEQAWWVAPQFGVATSAMVALAAPLAGAGPADSLPPTATTVAVEAAWFLAAYGASGLWGQQHAVGLALLYPLTWAARLAGRNDRGPLLVAGLALAAGGVLYEATLARTGAFQYTRPDVFGVPGWLVGIYLHGAPLLMTVTRMLVPTPTVARV